MRRNNKDILIGLIQTLDDKKCKDLFYDILETNMPKKEFKSYGNVRLTDEQYTKLLELWGEDKLNSCIDILSKYKEGREEPRHVSDYRRLTTWVEDRYNENAKPKHCTGIDLIDTAEKARKYIRRIPKELYPYDIDVRFLVERYGTDILK